MAYTVKNVADLAHVSVRTLHHYDELGLLVPSGRSESGYRLYDDADLARLQQILFYRELGFALSEVAQIMSDPGFSRRDALEAQREQLRVKALRLDAMIAAVDKAIDSDEKGMTMGNEEMFEVFGDFDPSEYEEEVEERWGDTEAYRESQRRTKRYTKDDWKAIKAEGDAIMEAYAKLLDEGVPADDPRVTAVAERARLQIDERFYPCSHQMHQALGQMYVADPRFTATYEKVRPGMAAYVAAAIEANLRERG